MALYRYDKDLKKVVPINEVPINGKISDYINMRKTWSGTTQIEFSTTTIEESVKKIRGGK